MVEHRRVRPDDLARVNLSFFHVNAIISVVLLAAGTVDCFVYADIGQMVVVLRAAMIASPCSNSLGSILYRTTAGCRVSTSLLLCLTAAETPDG